MAEGTSDATLRIGARGSPLALCQAEWVRDRLVEAHAGLEVALVAIRTKGDRILDAPLSRIGGKGLFTREIERALLDGDIDVAVHSLKDLPTALPEGLTLGAVCEREDPRDALVSKGADSLAALPQGAAVATGSLRRRAQLLHARPDLRVIDVRGNVGTRLGKFDASDWDAMVMARAGLARLGLLDRIACVIGQEELLPAVSQGALGVEIRGEDAATARLVAVLDHSPTRLATRAERSFLHGLGGGCQVPAAALATVEGKRLRLDGLVASLDGEKLVRQEIEGGAGDAEALGAELSERLLEAGAGSILESIRI
ncbi:MAG TPA: hydroxymethylbilane synthase [Sumerlaeia bacterium]|nr:hydroxymethylbilane synthase [Sumerlaeia bacterium]